MRRSKLTPQRVIKDYIIAYKSSTKLFHEAVETFKVEGDKEVIVSAMENILRLDRCIKNDNFLSFKDKSKVYEELFDRQQRITE